MCQVNTEKSWNSEIAHKWEIRDSNSPNLLGVYAKEKKESQAIRAFNEFRKVKIVCTQSDTCLTTIR